MDSDSITRGGCQKIMAKVKSIMRIKHVGKVYDLKVANTHTYNIDGLAVHNSAGGSLVAYCLRLTDIDPLEYGLLFERFLDYSRRPVSVNSFKV